MSLLPPISAATASSANSISPSPLPKASPATQAALRSLLILNSAKIYRNGIGYWQKTSESGEIEHHFTRYYTLDRKTKISFQDYEPDFPDGANVSFGERGGKVLIFYNDQSYEGKPYQPLS